MAMVEMVLVLPLLLLILFAIAEFGIMFSRWLTLSNAVREGARVAVVFRSPCNAGTVDAEVRTTVANYANAGGVPITPGVVNVSGSCAGEGTPVTVDATYQFPLDIPFLGYASADTAALADGAIDLTYSSTMRNE